MCMEFPFMDEHGDNAACCNNVHVHVVAHQDLAAYDVSQGQVVEDFSEEFDHLWAASPDLSSNPYILLEGKWFIVTYIHIDT